MWKLFFEICDVLCCLIPNRRVREDIRRRKLFDWRKKYNALRKHCPELDFRHVVMIKGGWNIGFIVDKKYVFKIKKFFDASVPMEKIVREKRITDAFQNISPLGIPKIDIVNADGYTFFKYNFMPGKNLNTCSYKQIRQHRQKLGQQLAEFIYAVHNARPTEIDDLRDERPGDGWNHNDICNNIIIDKKSMRIVGLIDWEYAGWNTLETEFNNITRFSKNMAKSGILDEVRKHYEFLTQPSKK